MSGRRPSRTLSEARCPRCYMRRALCLCPALPKIETATRVIVLMHVVEKRSTTNTGRVAQLALANSEVRLRGGAENKMSEEGLITPGRQSLLLFPSEDAVELNEEFLRNHPGPYTLVVPDGTWSQASRTAKRQPTLARMPRIKLKAGSPSAYRLRQAPSPEALSTLEAVAQALGVMEGPEVQGKLEELFTVMVERTLWSRGTLSLRQCKTGIPIEAIQENVEAGRTKRLPEFER